MTRHCVSLVIFAGLSLLSNASIDDLASYPTANPKDPTAGALSNIFGIAATFDSGAKKAVTAAVVKQASEAGEPLAKSVPLPQPEQETELGKAQERRLRAEAHEKELSAAVADIKAKPALAADKHEAPSMAAQLEAADDEEESKKADTPAMEVMKPAADMPYGEQAKSVGAPAVEEVSEKSLAEASQEAKLVEEVSVKALEKASQEATKKKVKGHHSLRTISSESKGEEFAKALNAPAKVAAKADEDEALSSTSIETAVSDLMMSGMMGGATPLGDTTKTIRVLIEKTMMPKIIHAHKANQKELNHLAKDALSCTDSKKNGMVGANKKKAKYLKFGPLHRSCRQTEAAKKTEVKVCQEEIKDKRRLKKLHCARLDEVIKTNGNQASNKAIVTKGGSESVDSYLDRVTDTICGKKGKGGLRDVYRKAKDNCNNAKKKFEALVENCENLKDGYAEKRQECDQLQDKMDDAACQRAVLVKDACESYAECFASKNRAYKSVHAMVKKEEKDRKAEWKALKRMHCLILSFKDGKVEGEEVSTCKSKTYDTSHLTIKYPKTASRKMEACIVPRLYPSTPSYKKREYAPLPALAKGKQDANECYGVLEVSTKPKKGSPKSCKCDRVTMNGPYSPGPVVKCVGCWDARRSTDKNSCPQGTKLFSPRTRNDWRSFLASATPLRAPHWIIDVTRPQNGCGGCTKNEMNSQNVAQKTWRTADNSPWWLRSKKYSEPNGDYHANCYLDLWHTPKDEDGVTFNDGKCNYHSKSYYCQRSKMSTRPKDGSPAGCSCKVVDLVGSYSTGALIKCTGCLDTRRTTQKNSCPLGTKLFAPRNRKDWKTFIASASPLRSPHWIVDVTRPQNGCGGCTRHSMNSASASQATWRTQDGAAWWLRSTKYSEPNGDYTANCYLDLWRTPANEDSVTFNDGRCNYHATSYYCQPGMKKK